MMLIRTVRYSLALVLLISALIFVSQHAPPAEAQDAPTLPWGEAVLGQVTAPEGTLYSFQGNSGDAIQIEVLGLQNFAPVVTFLDANRSTLGQEPNAAAQPTVTFNYTLPATATYYVLIQGVSGSTGQFTAILQRGLPPGIPLSNNTPTDGAVSPDFNAVYYDFSLNSNGNTRVLIRSTTPGYSPIASITNNAGDTIASVSGSALVAATLELGPDNQSVQLRVEIGDFQGLANFQVILNPATSTPPTSTPPPPTVPESTPEVSDSETLATCLVTSAEETDINVRSGGSTNHPIVDVMRAGTSLPAIGYNSANGTWYQVELSDGRVGWIASFVINTTGDCLTLPIANYGPPPAGPGPSPDPDPEPPDDDDPQATPSVSDRP